VPHYRIRSGAPDDVRVNHEVGITNHELKWLGIPSWNAWSNRLDPRSQMAPVIWIRIAGING